MGDMIVDPKAYAEWKRSLAGSTEPNNPKPPMNASRALDLLRDFAQTELECRESSFLPDPLERESGYITEAREAVKAIRFLALIFTKEMGR